MTCDCIEELALDFGRSVNAVSVSLGALYLQVSHMSQSQIDKYNESRLRYRGCRWKHSIEGAFHFKYCPFCGKKLNKELNCFTIANIVNKRLKEERDD